MLFMEVWLEFSLCAYIHFNQTMLWYTIANIDILTLEHMLGIFKKTKSEDIIAKQKHLS